MFFDGFEQARSGPPDADGVSVSGWTLTQFGYTGRALAVSGANPNYPLAVATYMVPGEHLLTRSHPWAGPRFALGVTCLMTAWPANAKAGRPYSTSGRGNIISITAGGERRVLWWSWKTGHIHLGAEPGNALPVYGRPYGYEVVLDRPSKTATVYINGKQDLVTPISDAMAAADAVSVGLGWMWPDSYQLEPAEPYDYRYLEYGSLYMNDGDRMGPINVTTRYGTRPLAEQWTEKGWVAQGLPIPPDAAAGLRSGQFIVGKTVGAKAPYKSSAALNRRQHPVVATKLGVFARKTRSAQVQLGMFIGGDEVAHRASTQPLEPTWTRHEATFDPKPGDTPDKIAAAPFGLTIEPQ